MERVRLKRDELIEDVEWMLDAGEIVIDNLARRCYTTPPLLERRLRRYGRADLVNRMTGTWHGKKRVTV